jgi:spore maturation protein CgeB
MKLVILDTYYPRFLKMFYAQHAELGRAPWQEQTKALLKAAFGVSDFYSFHLRNLGIDAHDLIVNCVPLQESWATENRVSFSAWALRLPHRTFRLPIIGAKLAALPGLIEVAVAQIRSLNPDVLYCQDLSFFTGDVLKELKSHVRMIVGQIACPLPPDSFLKGYDLILTSFPHFVPRLQALGVASEYFRIGFDARILELLGAVQKDIGASFVGGISRHHGKAVPLLEYVAIHTPIEFFGYGVETLPRSSPVRRRHHGEVWGLDMYRALARSKVTLNRHINVAENSANNMRLYEATGVGSLLITDRKDNLGELFEVGKEIVAYSSQEEAADLIRYYLDHPEEAATIARAGQARTLREHTYRHRMEELVLVLERNLRVLRS